MGLEKLAIAKDIPFRIETQDFIINEILLQQRLLIFGNTEVARFQVCVHEYKDKTIGEFIYDPGNGDLVHEVYESRQENPEFREAEVMTQLCDRSRKFIDAHYRQCQRETGGHLLDTYSDIVRVNDTLKELSRKRRDLH